MLSSAIGIDIDAIRPARHGTPDMGYGRPIVELWGKRRRRSHQDLAIVRITLPLAVPTVPTLRLQLKSQGKLKDDLRMRRGSDRP